MPKLVDHDKYREELLLKSFDLFASRGYANVTMRGIAKELNISTGALYHYFPNKQAMLEMMIEVIATREIRQILEDVYKTDKIEERVVIFLDYFKVREAFFKNVLVLLLDFKKFCGSADNQKTLDQYAEIIFTYIAQGVGMDRDFGSMAVSFLAGIGYMLLIVPEVVDVDKQMEILQQIVIPYLLATVEPPAS
ncbi:MAG: TetR/AcrR family transcriptional regulator [Thermodesulfobacteriota bacterium]|nr:TetR/AcrR family transcriptional regulator [Thermodesulfobacteriota bacterium]